MYLLSLYEGDAVVEASLGGRVTADEVRVFGEELEELVAEFEGRSYSLLLDLSKAKRLDGEAMFALGEVKDRCLAGGAAEIVSVPADEYDAVRQQSLRLQQVLEGRERFVAEAHMARIAARSSTEVRLAA